MDEGVVKESGNDTIDEEELILPNRNLRDRVEDNSVRSPRKSPRLMAQGNPPQEVKLESQMHKICVRLHIAKQIIYLFIHPPTYLPTNQLINMVS